MASALGAGGGVVLNSLQLTGFSPNVKGYAALDPVSFTFTALDSLTTLKFSDVATNNTVWIDSLIDNVSVTHNVPAPASLALLGLGLVGMAAVRRKKQQ